MDNKKLIPIVVVAAIILVGVVVFLSRSPKEIPKPVEKPLEEKGVVETAKDVSESVPEIQTNVGEKVPEVNPIDRANPYKYDNPLR